METLGAFFLVVSNKCLFSVSRSALNLPLNGELIFVVDQFQKRSSRDRDRVYQTTCGAEQNQRDAYVNRKLIAAKTRAAADVDCLAALMKLFSVEFQIWKAG